MKVSNINNSLAYTSYYPAKQKQKDNRTSMMSLNAPNKVSNHLVDKNYA